MSMVTQMIGRAGRPGYDTKGIALILTRATSASRYVDVLSGSAYDILILTLIVVLMRRKCIGVSALVFTSALSLSWCFSEVDQVNFKWPHHTIDWRYDRDASDVLQWIRMSLLWDKTFLPWGPLLSWMSKANHRYCRVNKNPREYGFITSQNADIALRVTAFYDYAAFADVWYNVSKQNQCLEELQELESCGILESDEGSASQMYRILSVQ